MKIIVDSLRQSCGSTTVAASLSHRLSVGSDRVLLVDADLLSLRLTSAPSLSSLFNVPLENVPGWLDSDQPLKSLIWKFSDHLHYLPISKSTVSESSSTDSRFKSRLLEIREQLKSKDYEHVVFDFGITDIAFREELEADLLLTVICPDSENLLASRVRSGQILSEDNRFLLLNKFDARSIVEPDIASQLLSMFGTRLCPVRIPLDDAVLLASLNHQPVNQTLSFSEAGNRFCDLANWSKTLQVHKN